MKTFYSLFFALYVFSISEGLAYNYKAVEVPPEGRKWTQTKWSLGEASAPSDKIKPSASDGVCLGGIMILDADAEVNSLTIPGRASLQADSHKLRVSNNLNMNFSKSSIHLKNGASLEVGGMFETHMDFRSTTLDGIIVDLEDSSFSVESVMSISLGGANVSKDRNMGFSANLVGKSNFSMGDFVVDSYLTDKDSKMFFAINFSNKGDKFPLATLAGGNMDGVKVNLHIDDKLPKGKYTFISAAAKKSQLDGICLSINGQPYEKFGKKIKVGNRNISVDKRKKGKLLELILSVN